MKFELLDTDTARMSLINRFARILLGNLALGMNDRILSIDHTYAGTTFVHSLEREHLRSRIKTAIERQQDYRKGDRWQPKYTVNAVFIASANENLQIQVLTTPVKPF